MKRFFIISIGQKYLTGLTGLGLALFVLMHMLGNLLIFLGPKTYNSYAHFLESNSFLIVFELGLAVLFVCHIIVAITLTIKNKRARGSGPKHPATGYKSTAWWQKTLPAQGALILAFVILHLITFKFGEEYSVTYQGETMRDFYRLVMEVFINPVAVVWYLVALLVLSLHLLHGLQSSFQSLGLNNENYKGLIKKVSWAYSLIVTLGYISLPLYVFFLS